MGGGQRQRASLCTQWCRGAGGAALDTAPPGASSMLSGDGTVTVLVYGARVPASVFRILLCGGAWGTVGVGGLPGLSAHGLEQHRPESPPARPASPGAAPGQSPAEGAGVRDWGVSARRPLHVWRGLWPRPCHLLAFWMPGAAPWGRGGHLLEGGPAHCRLSSWLVPGSRGPPELVPSCTWATQKGPWCWRRSRGGRGPGRQEPSTPRGQLGWAAWVQHTRIQGRLSQAPG